VNNKIKLDAKELKTKQDLRAQKLAEKEKEEKAKRKGSFFGFGKSKTSKPEEEDITANYEEQDEVRKLNGRNVIILKIL